MACTYKYLMLSRRARERQGVVVLDECHETVDQILSFAEFSFDDWLRDYWDLPPFPFKTYGPKGKGDILSPQAEIKVRHWLEKSAGILASCIDDTEEGCRARKIYDRIILSLEKLSLTDWFLDCGHGIISRQKKGRWYKIPGMKLRALDASPVAPLLWKNKQTALLMSATIGRDTTALATELGIGEHDYHTYNHPVPMNARPVFDLGLPRMTKRNIDSNPGLLTMQAAQIVSFIKSLPKDWRGVVLTSSYARIKVLRSFMQANLGDRLFVPSGKGPAGRIQSFVQSPRENIVAVDTVQGWGHGINLEWNLARFVVVAGVPFGNPYDPFVAARKKRSNGDRYYWWSAYNSIPQVCGRAQRGERFDNGDYLVSVAAIADGSALSPKARKHFPHWFKPERKNGEVKERTE
jgi:Rad3-related DNA helicase